MALNLVTGSEHFSDYCNRSQDHGIDLFEIIQKNPLLKPEFKTDQGMGILY